MTMATVDVAGGDTHLELAISGEIDMANADTVQKQLLAAITNQPTAVSLDLSGLTFLDSAGLRILFALADRLEILQIDLDVIVRADSIPRRAMELAGFRPLRTTGSEPAGQPPAPG
ncbi:MAG TPA: STAS domain-containing protein [Pseudonocardiaceae bacterium]